ncbi:hypothetical protein KHQ81_11480 [Mycoplasmatota bacterium]|nr:hypothetical protein KHQ81_11480 [Mycoplasmatota bacterium]
MNKFLNCMINYLWIYLFYLTFTLIFLALDVISINTSSWKLLIPLIISLLLYLVTLCMTLLVKQVKNKRILIIVCNLIIIGIMIVYIVNAVIYALPEDIYFSIFFTSYHFLPSSILRKTTIPSIFFKDSILYNHLSIGFMFEFAYLI